MMEQVLTKYNFRHEMGVSIRDFMKNVKNVKIKMIYDETVTNSITVWAVLIHKSFGEIMLFTSEEIVNEMIYYGTKNGLTVKYV